jgi:hypothetical protein
MKLNAINTAIAAFWGFSKLARGLPFRTYLAAGGPFGVAAGMH